MNPLTSIFSFYLKEKFAVRIEPFKSTTNCRHVFAHDFSVLRLSPEALLLEKSHGYGAVDPESVQGRGFAEFIGALEGSVPQVSGVAHNEIYNAGRCG